MNKKFKYIFFIFIFLMLIIPSNKLQAKTLNDMNKELAELKARKNTADNQKKLTKQKLIILLKVLQIQLQKLKIQEMK